MRTPNRTARKAAAIETSANKARTASDKAPTKTSLSPAGAASRRVAKPALGIQTGGKDRKPDYEVPVQPKRRAAKK